MAVHVSNSNAPRRRVSAWVLGGILSLVLVCFWALYLLLAPVPTTRPPPVANQGPVNPTASEALRVLAWRGLLPPEVVTGFESDTGLTVTVDRYDTLDELQALSARGALTHDLVLVSGIGLRRLADAGVLAPFDASRLDNTANLDSEVATRAAAYDPEGRFGVVVSWGTLGLAYDPAKIAQRLEADAPRDSWALLFDAERLAKVADCGVQIVDTPRGAFPIALRYLGLPPGSAAIADTENAARLWEGIRPSIARFSTEGLVDRLAAGNVCLALATSGDVFQARAKVAAAGGGPDIRYVIPHEGTVAWFAMLAIPEAAANPDAAHRLANYLLRPEVAARATNATGFTNAVVASVLYVRPEIKNDAALMPPTSGLTDFIVETDLAPEAAALRDRFWQLINTPASPAPASTTPVPAAPTAVSPEPESPVQDSPTSAPPDMEISPVPDTPVPETESSPQAPTQSPAPAEDVPPPPQPLPQGEES